MSMKNVSHSPVTEMLSGKYKIWLIIGLALLPIADFGACIALWVFGAAGVYWTLPFLMMIVDLAYLVCVLLSNQRFKYAQKLFFAYLAVSIVLFIVWIAQFAGDSDVVLANTVEAYCGLLHVVGIAAVGISYLYASRRMRAGRHIQLVLAIAFSAVALLALVVVYGVFVISDGYFGQGHGNLPLVYNYIGDDECEVTDIVYGRGDSVVIPYEFNGRKVTKVSANIFSYANIKSVTLNCDSDVELCSDINTSVVANANVAIYADKEAVDTIKAKLYQVENDRRWGNIALGNNVYPINLDEDEVCVTFDYNHDSYTTAQMEIIPTWYGKKGDTFRLTDIKSVDYVAHSDISNDDDLYYCYQYVGSSGGGYILSELQDGERAIDGAVITQSYNKVPVRFQRIYKIFTGIGNDDMYNPAEHFPFTAVDGVKQNYKLTVLDKADELLQSFDRGEAFIRTMQYAAYGSNMFREFSSLATLLGDGYSEVTIAPYWELARPQITLSRVNGDGAPSLGGVYYGDDYELTVGVTHPLDGIQIEYDWVGVQSASAAKNKQNVVQHASNVGIKTFSVDVTIRAPQITSCVSTGSAELTVSLIKRPLSVKWRMEGGGDVFDGNPRQILNEVENAADGEIVTIKGYNESGYAGTFTKQAEFVNNTQANYYSIVEGATYTYTIKPCPVALTWDEQTEFEYDRTIHCPTAHAFDLSGNELVIKYTGYGINAGDYSTTATIQNTNYTIDDASKKTMGFKITPAEANVTWSNTVLTYNGAPRIPSATASGVDNELVSLNVSGGQINANMVGGNKTTTYTATATSANSNYTLNPATASTEFTIEPYRVTVTWANTTVTYNGQRQLPTASAVGVNNRVVTATVSITGYPNGAVNADSYTATAAIADTNYTITSGATHAFTINKKAVSVVWDNTPLTYNGTEQAPTATAKGVNGEDLPLTVSGGRRNAGDGTATAAFTSQQQNYTLTNTSRSFSIEQKNVTISIENVTVAYGETPVYTFTATGIVQGDNVTITCSVARDPDGDGNIPVGAYNIVVGTYGTDSTNYSYTIVKYGTLTVTAPPEQTEE